LAIQLVVVDIVRVTRTRPGNLDAQDLAMRCSASAIGATEPSQWVAAYDLCRRALQIDDRNVLALGWTVIMDIWPVVTAQSTNPTEVIKKADELATRALAIDPNYDVAHFAKSMVLMTQNRHEEAIAEAERTLALNPSNIDAYSNLGVANLFLCRPDRAIEFADKAIRLSPRDPNLWIYYEVKGEAFFILHQDDHTIEWVRRSQALAPRGDPYASLLMVSALALTGQVAEAREVLKQYLANSNAKSTTIAQFRTQQLSLADSPQWVAYNDRFDEGLRIAGMPEQ
jgi:adenylate cyclase